MVEHQVNLHQKEESHVFGATGITFHIAAITETKSALNVATKGHAKHECRTQVKRKGTKSVHMMDGDSDSDIDQIYIKTLGMDINSINRADDVIKITPQVNDVSLEMELDTGAAVSVIPEEISNTKFPKVKIQPSDIVLKTYTGERIKPVSVAEVSLKYQN